mmetsp:Transcript_16599/g.24983  ORF Transcript_16599/g.24983 Transcript_16599/m.24983 type:complete len:141 (-) Transcript_16599:147-569(-)
MDKLSKHTDAEVNEDLHDYSIALPKSGLVIRSHREMHTADVLLAQQNREDRTRDIEFHGTKRLVAPYCGEIPITSSPWVEESIPDSNFTNGDDDDKVDSHCKSFDKHGGSKDSDSDDDIKSSYKDDTKEKDENFSKWDSK